MGGISVLILTYNEEVNLPGALDSLLGKSSDVTVLDSFSTDSTVRIAGEWGARLVQRKFDNYAAQRNAGLALPFANPWVLMIDADERVSTGLWREILAETQAAAPDVCMFRMRRKDYFLGRWIRHASGYPTWFGRVVRPGMVRVEREINEEYVPLGSVGYLKEHLIHYPFNRGIAHWVDRHNTYSTLESRRLREESREPLSFRAILSRDPVERRRALKRLAYKMPMRPSLVFAYLYLVRLGAMDGRAGFIYCRMRAAYELLINAKRTEAEWRERSAEDTRTGDLLG